jgi:hypothetical protein
MSSPPYKFLNLSPPDLGPLRIQNPKKSREHHWSCPRLDVFNKIIRTGLRADSDSFSVMPPPAPESKMSSAHENSDYKSVGFLTYPDFICQVNCTSDLIIVLPPVLDQHPSFTGITTVAEL